MRWRVPLFNPGDNHTQHSWLRVVNTSDADAKVVIRGLDDQGAPPEGEVELHSARPCSAHAERKGARRRLVRGQIRVRWELWGWEGASGNCSSPPTSRFW